MPLLSPSAPPPVVLLHGMLGGVDNWRATADALGRAGHAVHVPALPVYTAPMRETNVEGLTRYVLDYLSRTCEAPCVLVGNSLGGHVAICAAARRPDAVRALVLSGSSGLDEVPIGTSTPRRFDRAFVRDRTAFTFFDPAHATDELVDRMLGVLADRASLARLVRMARSARDTRVDALLPTLDLPTLLIWGRDDRITPAEVGCAFASMLPRSVLHWVDACGHAPMMEHPEVFASLLLTFLRDLTEQQV